MSFYRIAIVGVGIALGVWGVREGLVASHAKTEPQEISCEALGRDGPGDNAHVVLTDFIFPTGTFVFEEKKRGGGWAKVWVPTLPLSGVWHEKVLAILDEHEGEIPDDVLLPEPDTFSVIVRSSHVPGNRELDRLGDQDTLQGLVINEIDSLGREEKKILAAEYPGVDLDKCWIIDHKRKPKSAAFVIMLVAAGACLAALGLWLMLRNRRSRQAA